MRKGSLALAFAVLASFAIHAEGNASLRSPWSLSAAPAFTLPLVASDFSANEVFAPAWGASLGAEYAFAPDKPFGLRLGLGVSSGGFLPSQGLEVPGSMTEFGLVVGLSARTSLVGPLSLRAFLDAGMGYGFLTSGTKAPFALARLGGDLGLTVSPGLVARLEATWTQKFGVYGGLGLGLGLGYSLPARSSTQAPARLRLLDLSSLDVGSIFPIFRSYYDEHPLGTLRIKNTGSQALRGLRVSFVLRQYMDGPKECAVIPLIGPGKTVEVPLYGLFNDRILGVTEATKATAEIIVEYEGGAAESRTATVLVQDRNALTWDDDRHAAVFVSSKDPWVLDLSGNIVAATKDSRGREVPANLQAAIAFHEGLRVFGLGYVLSPNRPFAQAGGDLRAVDSLKFPRQTLGYRAGDCADLSVLYASFFEAAGIETAFITVPGHIFMAFDLGLSPEEAKARAMDESKLIVREGRVWVPVETTMRENGFAEVWHKAAAEWREASAAGSAGFLAVHDAWKTFAPVGLPADGSAVSLPSQDRVRAAFVTELAKESEAELTARLNLLGPVPKTGAQVAPTLNKRGVLYAKYGRLGDAERDFKAAAALQYFPATVNLGNLSLLRSDPSAAYAQFSQAALQAPDNAKVLVGLAKAAADLGKYQEVAGILDRIRKLDPALADQYGALGSAPTAGTAGARGASMTDESPLWN